jgi:hypothetical protein
VPFRWDPHTNNGTTGSAVSLTVPSVIDCSAIDVNTSGHVLAAEYSSGLGFVHFPFLIDSSLQAQRVKNNGGTQIYDARGFNDEGQIVGKQPWHPDENLQPLLWQPNAPGSSMGDMYELENPATTTVGGTALAINRNGVVVGSAYDGKSWRWTPTTPNATTGQFMPTGSLEAPIAINDAGTAVGGFGRACVFWPQVNDLNAWILPNSGWVLHTAKAINNSGWIAGEGTFGGAARGYLLRPTVWRPLQIAFLRYVVQIVFGVRAGGSGVVILPGRGPEPVPPWVDRVWKGASKSKQEALRAIAMTDAQRLLSDVKTHAKLLEMIPELRESPGPDKGRVSDA